MVWSANSPDGTISVKANTPNMLANTQYTKTTMNVDHFWDVGVNQDGHHKQVQMPKQATDITLGAGMDGGMYFKEVSASNTRVQGFYRNVNGIYQFIPAFQSGTTPPINSSSAFVEINAPIEPHSYGQIFLFTDDDTSRTLTMGFFKAGTNVVQAYSCAAGFENISSSTYSLKLGNDTAASGLKIRVRREAAPSVPPNIYQYRIIYWGM